MKKRLDKCNNFKLLHIIKPTMICRYSPDPPVLTCISHGVIMAEIEGLAAGGTTRLSLIHNGMNVLISPAPVCCDFFILLQVMKVG